MKPPGSATASPDFRRDRRESIVGGRHGPPFGPGSRPSPPRLSVGDPHPSPTNPLISSETYSRILEAHHRTGRPIVASSYAGTVGVPVLFARSLYPDLLQLEPTQGCKGVILIHREDAELIPCPEAECDVDTPRITNGPAGACSPVTLQMKAPVYLGPSRHHLVAPSVFEAMRPYFTEISETREVSDTPTGGRRGRPSRRPAPRSHASSTPLRRRSFTSGATESNNLVLKGLR